MKLRLTIIIAVGTAMFLVLKAQGNSTRKFFAGRDSDISARDPKRAEKAINKWTSPNGQQNDIALTAAPFFWDRTKVGRPVFIRVIKKNNLKGRLEIWLENPTTQKYEHFKTYRVAFYSGKLGPKKKEGDFQTPEGFYYVSRTNLNPKSNFHLSMDIGYPNAFDQAKGCTGSFIMIHGNAVSAGCLAMTDCSIEQIYTLVERALGKGQRLVRIHSFPFEMTAENLGKHKASPHYDFWVNLKEGWDWFAEKKRPPNVEVENGRYVFSAEP